MVRLISSSAFEYISRKDLFKAASPSSFSPFSCFFTSASSVSQSFTFLEEGYAGLFETSGTIIQKFHLSKRLWSHQKMKPKKTRRRQNLIRHLASAKLLALCRVQERPMWWSLLLQDGSRLLLIVLHICTSLVLSEHRNKLNGNTICSSQITDLFDPSVTFPNNLGWRWYASSSPGTSITTLSWLL